MNTFPPSAGGTSPGTGGGSSALPQLIDALADANGNPPTGYAWLPGATVAVNAGCSLTDYTNTPSPAFAIPCATGFVGCPAFVPANNFLTLTLVNAQTNNAMQVNVATAAGGKAASLIGAQILSDTSAFYAIKVQAVDNSWSLFTGVVAADGSVTLAASLAIPAGYDVYFVPQMLATMAGYHVFPVVGLNYIFINTATGTIHSDTQALPAGTVRGPTPRGLFVASDANGFYVQSRVTPVLLYLAATIAVAAGHPYIVEGPVIVVMPIPGATGAGAPVPFLPIAAAALPNGRMLLNCRFGFFEVVVTVAAGVPTVSVRQTAGVHPFVFMTEIALNSVTDDVRQMRYDVINGRVRTLSLRQEVSLDYTTLKALFVRKALLIA